MKYSTSILAVAIAVASTNASIITVTGSAAVSSSATVYPSAVSSSASIAYNTTATASAVYASTTSNSFNATAYPSSCIVFVSGTGLPVASSTAASSNDTILTSTVNAGSPVPTSVIIYRSTTANSAQNVTFATTSSARTVTTFPSAVSSISYNATFAPHPVTSIYATVYTTAPGAVTTVYPSSYFSHPTATAIPVCGAGEPVASGTTVTFNASSTSVPVSTNDTNAIAANADLITNGASVSKGSISAVLVSMGAAAGLAIAGL